MQRYNCTGEVIAPTAVPLRLIGSRRAARGEGGTRGPTAIGGSVSVRGRGTAAASIDTQTHRRAQLSQLWAGARSAGGGGRGSSGTPTPSLMAGGGRQLSGSRDR